MLPRGLTAALEPLDRLALIIAAVVHDVGHPGVDNEFLNRTESVASHLWFCDAPLERFHAVTASSLMRRPEMRFHGRFPPETAEAFEAKVRALVLATDMRRHFEVIEALEGFILEVNPPPPAPTPPPERGSDDETETESEDASDDDDDGEAGAKKDLKPWEEPEEEPPELTCVSPGSVPAAAADLAAEEMRVPDDRRAESRGSRPPRATPRDAQGLGGGASGGVLGARGPRARDG